MKKSYIFRNPSQNLESGGHGFLFSKCVKSETANVRVLKIGVKVPNYLRNNFATMVGGDPSTFRGWLGHLKFGIRPWPKK